MAFSAWHSRHDETPVRVPAIGLELRVRLPSESTGGVLAIFDTITAPGHGPPAHRHAETEVFRVLEGRYLFEVDGRRFVADAGDVVSIPGGAAHAFVNVTDQPSRSTVIMLPGIDVVAFFTGLAAVMPGGVPDRQALDAFGRTWGMQFLGPPLKP
jgi:quercetin dioxygenase-like cupin family protein